MPKNHKRKKRYKIMSDDEIEPEEVRLPEPQIDAANEKQLDQWIEDRSVIDLNKPEKKFEAPEPWGNPPEEGRPKNGS